MVKVTLKIDVHNVEELIRQEKGWKIEFLSRIIPAESRKKMVEDQVKQKIVQTLDEKLTTELKKSGVEADIAID